jgi:uncharacterized protein with von Willebrand factor type A (vWA) domain
VIVGLVRELRSRGVPVGMQEAVALARALAAGLHDSSFEQFYHVARAVLIHDEAHLDDFDQVFSHLYKGVAYAARDFVAEVEEWLRDPAARPAPTPEDRALLEAIDLEDLKRTLEERLRDQDGRHDGGDFWVGTGGRSPFGTNGRHPAGVSLRPGARDTHGGGRSAIRLADARRFRGYRTDLVLDVRQLEVALRKLRSFDRDARPTELDLDRTVDATARNFGELEIVMRRPRRPATRVILLMDVGGSMDPFAHLVSQLFSAARRATHWKELRTYYFHNCVYGRVFETEGMRESVAVRDLVRLCDDRYNLIVVGDAAMAPYELLADAWASPERGITGLDWLGILRRHFRRSIWLNPDMHPGWRFDTATAIAGVFPMFPLTVAGLEESLKALMAPGRFGSFPGRPAC